MASPTASHPWRGYVNMLIYNLGLRGPVEDEVVARFVEALLLQLEVTHPPEVFYDAMVRALASGEAVAALPGQDEAAARDLLVRLVKGLDERRPWPARPFEIVDREPDEFREAPVIGRIPHTKRIVENSLNQAFTNLSGGGHGYSLVLRLSSGHVVALFAGPPFSEPGVDVRAYSDPAATLEALCALTGLDVQKNVG
jgi:hypothetical protein